MCCFTCLLILAKYPVARDQADREVKYSRNGTLNVIEWSAVFDHGVLCVAPGRSATAMAGGYPSSKLNARTVH